MTKLSFILSTGRTGTKFFEDYFNATSQEAFCLHEPKPSRRFKFLSNKYLQGKVTDSEVADSFEKGRVEMLSGVRGSHYIESNNFIFGCIKPLNQKFEDIRILHIVRNPVKYTFSHLGHGFWNGHKKFFAKHVPYWLEDLKLDKEQRKDPHVILVARWIYVNRQIGEYSKSNQYMLVRFEDLFGKDKTFGSEVLNGTRDFLGLEEFKQENNIPYLSSPKNVSKKSVAVTSISAGALEYLKINGADLLDQYQYKPE